MAIKYIPYFPNTLEGQAVLDNFVRTKRILRYRDNDRVEERIQQGMPLYETVAGTCRQKPERKSRASWRMPFGLCLPERQRYHGGLGLY